MKEEPVPECWGAEGLRGRPASGKTPSHQSCPILFLTDSESGNNNLIIIIIITIDAS